MHNDIIRIEPAPINIGDLAHFSPVIRLTIASFITKGIIKVVIMVKPISI